MREHLGSTTAALVRYQPARTPPAVLVALLAEISRRQWHPAAAAAVVTTAARLGRRRGLPGA